MADVLSLSMPVDGSGSVGYSPLISCSTCLVNGGGGCCRTAASALPFSPALVSVLTFLARALSFCVAVVVFFDAGLGLSVHRYLIP